MTVEAMEQEPFSHRLFVVAGFPRTGTTSIFYNLDKHPSFVTARLKELNFFSSAGGMRRGGMEVFFDNIEGRICVDASPLYSLDPDAPVCIRSYAPGAKVLLLLRRPDEWIISLYRQVAKYTPMHMTNFEAFVNKPVVTGNGISIEISPVSGIYRQSVERFAKEFGDDLLVADFDLFVNNPVSLLKQIEEFCGAERYFDEKTAITERNNTSEDIGFLSRWISYLTLRTPARDIVKLVPKPLIRRMQRTLYGRPASKRHQISAAQLQVPDGLFASDRSYYEQLFANGAVISGEQILAAGHTSRTASPNPVRP